MKKAFLTSLFFGLCLGVVSLQAQIHTPAKSPGSKIVQDIGLTQVTVEYSRPGVKGREIFGGLVPYDKQWRLGANAPTKITFDDDVTFGGVDFEKGSYTMTAAPGKSEWTFLVSAVGSSDDAEPVKIMGEVQTLGDVHVENMFITFDQLKDDGAILVVAWDDVSVGVPIALNTDEDVMANIDKVMGGPSMQDYYNASSYYLTAGKDLDKALKWNNKAIDMGYNRYWVHRNKALILAKKGDKEGAVKAAKKSLELAKEAGNMNMVKSNEDSIKEWMM